MAYHAYHHNALKNLMKLYKLPLGICLIWLWFLQGAFAQVSDGKGLTPLEGVVIPKEQISQPQVINPGAAFKDCDECPEMVVIPAGTFLMGAIPNFEGGLSYEEPQHRVQIQAFAIGKYEVTQEQWFAVMGDNPSLIKGSKLPVNYVGWHDAQLFVQKLSQKIGKKYRLVTEAEWEYAARAGSTTIYPWGDSDAELSVYAWSNVISRGANVVGLKKPNQFDLHDMIGNVWEWTQDCWNENYSGAPTDGSAWTKGDCSRRVVRGGSSYDNPHAFRSAKRTWNMASNRYLNGVGFRVARTL